MQCAGIIVLMVAILNLGVGRTYDQKVCYSSERSVDLYSRFPKIKDSYTNCTYLQGNLEISKFKGEDPELSFLKDIREVTGYVSITNVGIQRFRLPNLAIIHGRTLTDNRMHGGRFALLVEHNEVEVLELPALREISAGDVKISDNRNLCFLNTIEWAEIVKDTDEQNVTFKNSLSSKSCSPCHPNCTGGCWGPLSCQKVSEIHCSRECRGRRCFGPDPRQCCHPFCAGGCSGPTASDCFACKNVSYSGACKEKCSFERGVDYKYTYGPTCVEECPDDLFREDGACVESCSGNNVEHAELCRPCVNGSCGGVCPGGIVLPTNIHRYRGCTSIWGVLRINNATFEGYPGSVDDSSKMHPNELEVFSTLTGLTGALEISGNHPDFKNLTFFRNLRYIYGRSKSEQQYALYISGTSLESLNLRSLESVQGGDVLIMDNPKLCFPSGINWKQFMESESRHPDIIDNAASDYCRERGLVCHQECRKDDGCWGAGRDECRSCKNYKLNGTCVPDCDAVPGFYDAGQLKCARCHFECLGGCFGPGPTKCAFCRNLRDDVYCLSECPVNKYNESGECKPCDENCANGCTGPKPSLGPGGCNSCRRAILSNSTDIAQFNCIASCPADKPNELHDVKRKIVYCSDVDPMAPPRNYQGNSPAIIGGVSGGILFLIICGVLVYKWIPRKENNLLDEMEMGTYEDDEPLVPSNVTPNLAKLIIIKDSDLRKIGNLGCGAFGTVYKGLWIPEGENVKVPVAIKVLKDGSSPNMSDDIIEEACMTASVDHPNLLKVLGICMTSQIMLVTQLMPLGCLLDYVRSNKGKIGSKALLSWCSQIAQGMAYLEEKRMVHRDLALRNVLVKNPDCVKITDFGMAKVLGVNEEAYKAEDGKMPIKWLALECFQHRIFTHKSDVWAFGVTVWEMLTYGARPYENTSARNVPELLEKGDRLPQPSICSIDVYRLMLKCWIEVAEARPAFTKLAEEFSKMACDPDSYLVIDGDRQKQLPPFSPCAVKQVLEAIASSVGDSGVTMEAEEYLHHSYPKYHTTEPGAKHEYVNTDPLAQLNECLPGCSSDGVAVAEVYTEQYVGFDPASSFEEDDSGRPISPSPDTTVSYANLPGDAQ